MIVNPNSKVVKTDTNQVAQEEFDPLGLFTKEPTTQEVSKQSGGDFDPLGLFTKEEPVAQEESKEPRVSPILDEAHEELGFNKEYPVSFIREDLLTPTTPDVLATQMPEQEAEFGRNINIADARKSITELLGADFSEEEIGSQREVVASLQPQYEEAIKELREEGYEEEATSLEKELSNVKELSSQLLKEASEEFDAKHGTIKQAGNQLKRSYTNLIMSLSAREFANDAWLNTYEEIDETGEVPNFFLEEPRDSSDPRGEMSKMLIRTINPLMAFISEGSSGVINTGKALRYRNASSEEKDKIKAKALSEKGKLVENIVKANKTLSEIPTHPQAEKFLQAETYTDVLDALIDDPTSVVSEILLGNAIQLGASLASGGIGAYGAGPFGAAAASGATSAFFEYGNLILDELSRNGIDIESEKELIGAFKNKELMNKVRSNAKLGSDIVGFFDGLTMFIASKKFMPAKLSDDIARYIGKEALEGALQVVLQGGTGAAGAGASQYARTGEGANAGQISASFLGEGAFALVRTPFIGRALKARSFARAKYINLENHGVNKVLQELSSKRAEAESKGNIPDVMEADKLIDQLTRARDSMIEGNVDLLAEYRDTIKKEAAKLEKKKGAKASERADFQTWMRDIESIDKILEEHQSKTEKQDEKVQPIRESEKTQGEKKTVKPDAKKQKAEPTDKPNVPPTGEPVEPGVIRELGTYLKPEGEKGAADTNRATTQAWENKGRFVKKETGKYAVSLDDYVFSVERTESGKWVISEEQGNLAVDGEFSTRKEAAKAAQDSIDASAKTESSPETAPISSADEGSSRMVEIRRSEAPSKEASDKIIATLEEVKAKSKEMSKVKESRGDKKKPRKKGSSRKTTEMEAYLHAEAALEAEFEAITADDADWTPDIAERADKLINDLSNIRDDMLRLSEELLKDFGTKWFDIEDAMEARVKGVSYKPAESPKAKVSDAAPVKKPVAKKVLPIKKTIAKKTELQTVQEEIATLEALERPTEQDNDRLMDLRDKEEALSKTDTDEPLVSEPIEIEEGLYHYGDFNIREGDGKVSIVRNGRAVEDAPTLQDAAKIIDGWAKNPETIPDARVKKDSPLKKRDDGADYIEGNYIKENFPRLHKVAGRFGISDADLSTLSDLYVSVINALPKTARGMDDLIATVTDLESAISLFENTRPKSTKQEVIDRINTDKGYSAEQKQLMVEFIKKLKGDELFFFKDHVEPGKKGPNAYGLSRNVLSSRDPAALAHEVGHWGFYNILTAEERIQFFQEVKDRFYKDVVDASKLKKEMALAEITLEDGSKIRSNAASNFSEYFAEQFRQYVFDKSPDKKIVPLFERLKEYVDILVKAFRETGYNPELVKYFDKIVDLKEPAATKKAPAKKTFVSKKYKESGQTRLKEARDIIEKTTDKNEIQRGESNEAVKPGAYDNAKEAFIKNENEAGKGITPENFKNLTVMATFQIESGIRSFSDFAKVMIADVGEQVIPHLRNLYHGSIKEVSAKNKSTIDKADVSDRADINRFFFDYHKSPDIESYTVSEATKLVSDAIKVTDSETAPGLQHAAMTEYAAAVMNDSSSDIITVIDFVKDAKEKFGRGIPRNVAQNAWFAALYNAEAKSRAGFLEGVSERFNIGMDKLTYYSDFKRDFLRAVQDSFIDQKIVEQGIRRARGDDYFIEFEHLSAYLIEELSVGAVSGLQRAVADVSNRNSTIRKILQAAVDNNIQQGDWAQYYNLLEKAQVLRESGKPELANALEKKAINIDPNKTDEIQQYLRAKHAEEGNAYLAKLADDIDVKIKELIKELETVPKGEEGKRARESIKEQIRTLKQEKPVAENGTGMSNEEAQAILNKFDIEGKSVALEEISVMVKDVINKTLDEGVKGGLTSEATATELRARYKNYVPLNRILFGPFGDFMGGMGGSAVKAGDKAQGAGFRRRTGSDRPVDNIVQQVMRDYKDVVANAAKNKIVTTLANLYDSEFALGNETLGRSVPFNSGENVRIAEKLPYRQINSDGSVSDRMLIFNDATKGVHRAMTRFGSGPGMLPNVTNAIRTFMNYLRFVITSGSINFIYTNTQKDIGTVMANMASDFGHGASIKFAKNMTYNKSRFFYSQKAINDHIYGRKTDGAANYQELVDLGGTTGRYQLSDRADVLREVRNAEKKMNDFQKIHGKKRAPHRVAQKYFEAVINKVEIWNDIMENATRLTAYNMALEHGLSKKRAASYALNINTNFNRSGDMGFLFKVGYQFANSAIQGHARLLHAAKTSPKAFTQTAMSLMAFGAAANAYNDWYNKEEHDRLKRSRPQLFNNNIVIIGPGGVILKLYMPFGYNVFKTLGDISYDLAHGNIEGKDASIRFGNSFADAFNPFRGSELFSDGPIGLVRGVTPTALTPATELAVNKSFAGSIYPPFMHTMQESLGLADFQVKYDSVNPYMDYVSKFMYKYDISDMSPETIEYLTYFFTGSAGREWINLLTKTVNRDNAVRDGFVLYTRDDGTDVKVMPNHIPIISKLMSTIDQDRLAISSIYRQTIDNSSKSMDMDGAKFGRLLENLTSDYAIVLSNDFVPEDEKLVMFTAINSFVKTVFKNNIRDEVIETVKKEGLTGDKNKAARLAYYDKINRQTRSYRVPQIPDIGKAVFVNSQYSTSRAVKVLDKNIIDQLEAKLGTLKLSGGAKKE